MAAQFDLVSFRDGHIGFARCIQYSPGFFGDVCLNLMNAQVFQTGRHIPA
jgi:hypothetical protein